MDSVDDQFGGTPHNQLSLIHITDPDILALLNDHSEDPTSEATAPAATVSEATAENAENTEKNELSADVPPDLLKQYLQEHNFYKIIGDLESLLKESRDGQLLLKTYNNNKCFQEDEQDSLVKIIYSKGWKNGFT